MCLTRARLGPDCQDSRAAAVAGAGMTPKVLAAAPLSPEAVKCGAQVQPWDFHAPLRLGVLLINPKLIGDDPAGSLGMVWYLQCLHPARSVTLRTVITVMHFSTANQMKAATLLP